MEAQRPFLAAEEKEPWLNDSRSTKTENRRPRREIRRSRFAKSALVTLVVLLLLSGHLLGPLRYAFGRAKTCVHRGPTSIEERVLKILNKVPLIGDYYCFPRPILLLSHADIGARRPQ